jgi:hypothetical protein
MVFLIICGSPGDEMRDLWLSDPGQTCNTGMSKNTTATGYVATATEINDTNISLSISGVDKRRSRVDFGNSIGAGVDLGQPHMIEVDPTNPIFWLLSRGNGALVAVPRHTGDRVEVSH